MLEVFDLLLNPTLDLGNFPALFLPVVATVFFTGETTLFTAQTVVFRGKVRPVHAVAITRVDVVVDAEVDSNVILSIQVISVGFVGECGVFNFETERDVPFRDKEDDALDVTELSESDVYEIEEPEYVRKAEVDEERKETRLQGLKDQLAAVDGDEAEDLRNEIEELEDRIEKLTEFKSGVSFHTRAGGES